MADKKISQLTTLAQADVAVTADFLPIVDTSATETKKATPQALVQAGATGATLPVALGAVGTPSYTFTGDLNTGLWSPAADTVAVSTGGSERLRVDSSGNVGIGTASPAARLQVKTQTNANAAFQNSTSVAGGVKINCFNDAGSASSPFELDGSTLQFNIASVERMRLDSSGNLGIGTASPGGYGGYTALAVNNATNGGLIDLMTNGTRHLTLFAGATASMIGTASNTALQIQTNGTERMRITATGNIVAGASAALATTATDGFLYVPTCAGTPTGTPTAVTGMAPIVVDTTNNKMYFYSGGQWRDAGP